jgi:hypothetical protein
MDSQILQQLFGTANAKLYIYTSAIPTDTNVNEFLTVKFANTVGTNLVTCVVSEVQGTHYIYTTHNYTLNNSDFVEVLELPLPVVIDNTSNTNSSNTGA